MVEVPTPGSWSLIPGAKTLSWGYRTFVNIDCGKLALGALAGESTAVTALNIDSSRDQGASIKKVKAHFSFEGKTANQGPIIIGFSAGLTGAEITESIRADPTSFTNATEFEEARRRLYPWAVINFAATTLAGENSRDSYLDTLRDFPRWDIIEGSSLSFFAHNCGTGALTTGTDVYYETRITQEWIKD